ncbi:hypothetical protein FBU30_002587, partial [Linnemannia zychae]
MQMWLESIIESQGKALRMPDQDDPSRYSVYAWSTNFQLQIIKENSGIVHLDATHNTTTHIIRPWLVWLRDHCGLKAEVFMVDCAIPQQSAILSAFPTATILFCAFHVAQAWQRKLNTRPKYESNAMRPFVNALRREESKDEQDRLWNEFQTRWPNHDMTKYIKKWFDEGTRPKWAAYARQAYPDLTTNNLIESWHKSLKRIYLGKERNVRPDYLMYVLMNAVERDFRISYFLVKQGYQAPSLSTQDKLRKKKAFDLPAENAALMVQSAADQNI